MIQLIPTRYPLGSPRKGPLNGCVCVCVCELGLPLTSIYLLEYSSEYLNEYSSTR